MVSANRTSTTPDRAHLVERALGRIEPSCSTVTLRRVRHEAMPVLTTTECVRLISADVRVVSVRVGHAGHRLVDHRSWIVRAACHLEPIASGRGWTRQHVLLRPIR